MDGLQDVGSVSPTALANGDFDEDGIQDLVCAYSVSDRGLLSLLGGHLPARGGELFQLRSSLDLPIIPDFLVTGDFDNDGHWDAVVASRGGHEILLLSGDGRGSVEISRRLPLPGAVSALSAGDINRRDGLLDLAVAIMGPTGAELLVYEGPDGAVNHDAEAIDLPGPATSIAFGRLDGDGMIDLVVGAGQVALVVHGRDRDRSTAARTRIDLPERVISVGVLEFVEGPVAASEVAVLTAGGTLRILGAGEDGSWTVLQAVKLSGEALLLPIKLPGRSLEDLLLIDRTERTLHVTARRARGALTTVSAAELSGEPVAVASRRLNADGAPDLLVAFSAEESPEALLSEVDASFVVTTTSDSGAGSLRQAILDANANPGADAIEFDIPGAPPHTIPLTSSLPSITDAVIIDGRSQPGWAGDPVIALDGSAAGISDGLALAPGSDGSSIRDLAIHSFAGRGISVGSTGNLIEGNFVGTDATGTVDLGNTGEGIYIDAASNVVGGTPADATNLVSGNGATGIFVDAAGMSTTIEGNLVGTDNAGAAGLGNDFSGIVSFASNVTIGGTAAGAGNVVSGNAEFGIGIGAGSNLVQGNLVGTNLAGTAAIGNGFSGIHIVDGASNTIGGTAANAGNSIAGNAEFGVSILGNAAPATANSIQGNLIGTDGNGAVDLGNSKSGIIVEEAFNNVVGGTTATARNVISGNDEFGVVILGSGASANKIRGNFIGTDVSGTAALGNAFSGVIIQGAPDNLIGGTTEGHRNVISGNGQSGCFVRDDAGPATGNQLQGNFIGVDATGALALGNALSGLFVESAGNQIGGTAAGAGNVISGNGEAGVVLITSAATGNSVEGNLIGTDHTGTSDLGNSLAGVLIQDASMNTVGGTVAGARNIISGNEESGVFLVADTGLTSSNVVQGNYIGTAIGGTSDLGNRFNGVSIRDADSNTIGGTMEAARNVLSANDRNGVLIVNPGALNNRIEGNHIGTDVDGILNLGNGIAGVRIEDAPGNSIGGTADGSGNVIAFNQAQGISVVEISSMSASGNELLRNSIFQNSALGIDLGDVGVTANDFTDPDEGPNGLQNTPVLTAAEVSGQSTTVAGTLNGVPNTDHRIEIFSSTACDPSGFGEGETYRDLVAVTTDNNGDASFSVVLPTVIPIGHQVTATATSSDGTSEFAQCDEVLCAAAPFPEPVLASADKNRMTWSSARNVTFVKGDLEGVGSYSFFDSGSLPAATSLDISPENPGPGDGVYYLVRDEPCGSWQTSLGAEPGRDGGLP